MWAFVETVKTQEHGRPGPQGYRLLRTYASRFTLNGQRQLCADVGEKRGTPLLVFNEGDLNHISGYYQKTPDQEEIMFCLDADVTERNIAVADPFQAQNPDVDAVIQQLDLQHPGQDIIDGRVCDIVRAGRAERSARGSARTQWWIDQQSHLLVKMTALQSNGTELISRYAYDHINEPLNFMAYMPNISYQWVCAHKQMLPPLDEGSHRFIELQDGSSGSMDVQWGKHNPQARESISLQ